MNPTILTQKEQELLEKYEPLFAAQHFTLSVSNLGGTSNHWKIEDSIFPNFAGHRFYKVFELGKLADFELWLEFYLDCVTSYRFLESFAICKNVNWNANFLDYTNSNYTLVALFDTEGTDFYEIEGTFNFEVGSDLVTGRVVATLLSSTNIQLDLPDGTPLKIKGGAFSNIQSELIRYISNRKILLNDLVVRAIEKLDLSVKRYIKEIE